MPENQIRGPFAWASQVGYSQAVTANGLVFVSGQFGCADDGSIVPGGFREQARATFENLGRVLEAAGTGFEHLVQLRGFLLDRGDFDAYREIRAEYVPGTAFTTLVVCVADFTFPGMLIEIEAVAQLPVPA